MAHSEEPLRAPSSDATEATGLAPPGSAPREALALFAAALAICLVIHVAVAVPGPWFPSATPTGWTARDLVLARGTGGIAGSELVVAAADPNGSVLVTVTSDFRSSDYRVIAWAASDVPDTADVRLLWRSEYAPGKLNSAPVKVEAGRLLPVTLAGHQDWLGRITGLALTFRGPLPRPVRIRGVAAKPMGALEILGDRLREWLAFEGWTATSIDSVTGGADVQDLPLPALLATAVALAALAWLGLARATGRAGTLPAAIATLFVAAWLLLDVRWTWNLVRQVRATAQTYAGKDWREKHAAAEDGALFEFIERVRAKLPAAPVRVFIAADADYLRDRGAYHLYPHNVGYDPYRNTIPPAGNFRPGDYFVVYQRRGVQFDPVAQRLRWDGGDPVAAELLLSEPGAALFRIR